VSLRGRIKRLERAAQGETIVIPQRDGTVRRFPEGAAMEAYVNLFERLGAGEDAPPEHPLIEAARNSSDSEWSQSFYAVNDPKEWIQPVVDLSE
jgi:hypothetical protein